MADSESTLSKSPAFQFYPKDFLGDGDQAGMSLQETGAYVRLMCFEWNAHGEGITDDVTRIARKVGASVGAMRKMWSAIRPLFAPHQTIPGRLIHPRLQKERDKQAAYRRRQSDAAAKRWQSHGTAVAVPPHMPEPSQQDGSQSSISNLRTSDFRQRGSRRDQGLMAGSSPLAHGDCLVHGPVCFKPRNAAKFLPRFGGDHAAMVAWATTVCDDWSDRVERGERVPEGDDFKFWDARYTESHATQTPSESRLTTNLRRASEEFLKS